MDTRTHTRLKFLVSVTLIPEDGFATEGELEEAVLRFLRECDPRAIDDPKWVYGVEWRVEAVYE